jgi:hypothetical protein
VLIKKPALMCIIFFMFTGLAFGEMAGLELNVNASDVEGKFEFRLPHYEINIMPGAAVLYSDDNYLISNMNLSIREQVFSPALSLGLGFEGTFGTAEQNTKDYDMGALGFLLIGEYDFRKDYATIPVSIITTFSGSPAPLCFMETERFFDFTLTVYGHIIKNASVLAGFRHLNFHFEKNATEVKITDNAVFLGCKLHF